MVIENNSVTTVPAVYASGSAMAIIYANVDAKTKYSIRNNRVRTWRSEDCILVKFSTIFPKPKSGMWYPKTR
jgi:hypothetical protein